VQCNRGARNRTGHAPFGPDHRSEAPGLKAVVVIPSTIACGNCSYRRSGYTAQCDDANPNSQALTWAAETWARRAGSRWMWNRADEVGPGSRRRSCRRMVLDMRANLQLRRIRICGLLGLVNTGSTPMGRIMPFAPRVLRGYPHATEALDPAELVLLLGLRGWVGGLRRGTDPMPRLGESMAEAGAPGAAASLDMFMRIVARTARRPVELRCPSCPRLAQDEQHLLHAARLAQGREAWLAEEVLRDDLLSRTGAEFALGPLQGLAEFLLEAGLTLRPRSLVDLVDGNSESMTPWLPPPPVRH